MKSQDLTQIVSELHADIVDGQRSGHKIIDRLTDRIARARGDQALALEDIGELMLEQHHFLMLKIARLYMQLESKS
ncbi:MAG: hypothetical protein ACLP19_27155 [Xanthobacteraceae bacterium]